MPMKYRIDVLAALKAAGFTSYRLRKENIMGESTIQKLRDRKPVTWETIETLCGLLHCQPADILIYEE